MRKFIPAIRNPVPPPKATLGSIFAPKKNKPKMVIIPFGYAPMLRKFRFGEKWWWKTNWNGATVLDTGHELKLPEFQLVAVFFKDLSEEAKTHIL